jgi:hypothetical protein
VLDWLKLVVVLEMTVLAVTTDARMNTVSFVFSLFMHQAALLSLPPLLIQEGVNFVSFECV